LENYLKRPSPSSVVVFIADEFDKRRKMAKMLIEHACAVEFVRMQDGELVNWARKEIREAGCDAEEKAIFHLVGLVGDNLRRLTSEIKKVATAALPDKIVTFELVDSLVTNSREIPNFNLTDQLFGDNKRRAMQTLKKILDDGGEPLMLLGLLAQNIRKLLMASELCDRGVDRSEIVKVMKLHPRHHEEFIALARRTDSAKLVRVIDRLADADVAIKTSRGGGGNKGAKMQIEILVSEILAI
jgi:DNA polymerase-3 subunit delta